MSKDQFRYNWNESEIPTLREHSKAKHGIYREYLKRYIRELTQDVRISKLTINLVDGFAGGGVYRPEHSIDLYYGSPIIFASVMTEMQVEIQSRRRSPFLLDYKLHLIDSNIGAQRTLPVVLREQGFAHLINDRIFVHTMTFEEALPMLLPKLRGHGSTIFVLDQFGYSGVPLDILRRIFKELSKPEVILTFAYDQLATWVQQYDRLNRRLIGLGVGSIDRKEFELAITSAGGREAFIERTLHQTFLTFAKYFTPFFVMSRGSNMAYWLVHLSMHAQARHVMTRLHWELQNSFAHYGGPGFNMLGYDPNNPPPNVQSYMFDDDALSRTLWQLQTDLPPMIGKYTGGVTLKQFFAEHANDSTGDLLVLRRAVIEIAALGGLEVRTPNDGEKRSISTLKLDDVIRLPQQPTLVFLARVPSLFARQPTGLVGPPIAKPLKCGSRRVEPLKLPACDDLPYAETSSTSSATSSDMQVKDTISRPK